jgi:16S rRNA A1518/A1519 N6-dimethyltransferase RsmA/KsgA/DIM1 with predicted DNA glycosylase/AP lyase activity
VVVLEPKSPPVAEETPIFTELVHRAFQQRRKQLRNAWRGVAGKSMTQLEVAAAAARIDLAERGECLSVERFRDMARELENG